MGGKRIALFSLVGFFVLAVVGALSCFFSSAANDFFSSHVAWVFLGGGCIVGGASFVLGSTMGMRQEADSLAHAIDELSRTGDSSFLPRTPVFSSLVSSLEHLLEDLDKAQCEHSNILASNRVLAREMSDLFRLLDAMDEGLIVVGAKGHILYANSAAGPFLSAPTSEVRGKSVKNCIHHPELFSLLSGNNEDNPSRSCNSVELSRDDENQTCFAVSKSHARGDEGEGLGEIFIFRDVSRVKKLEQLQTDFVEVLAQELHAPLTAIRSHVKALIDEDSMPSRGRGEHYQALYEEAYRLPQLVDNLLNVSMLKNGTVQPDIAPTHIEHIVEESAETVRPRCDIKKISLVLDLPNRLPAFDLDKRLFRVALMNVLENAVKYTESGGTITLSSSSLENEFHLDVSDTGIGIAEEDKEHIFDKFYRSESVLEMVQGSGVGLATALEIVRLHGGDILVNSKVGTGSRFSITLPRKIISLTEKHQERQS